MENVIFTKQSFFFYKITYECDEIKRFCKKFRINYRRIIFDNGVFLECIYFIELISQKYTLGKKFFWRALFFVA